MKLLMGCGMLAGLLVAPPVAVAQVPAPPRSEAPLYRSVSDFDGPYAEIPEPVPVPRYGPTLLPPREVYTVVREGGFSPLGAPQQRGLVYMISVIDRDGEDGRLVIDARTGRIIRFMPAYRMGERLNDGPATTYGPVGAPVSSVRNGLRPPAPIPHVASRRAAVPLPKASPSQTGESIPGAAKPAAEPAQQSAAVDAKPGGMQTGVQAAPPPTIEPKRVGPQILPTQEMPKVQALD